jgi:hypothetical protein
VHNEEYWQVEILISKLTSVRIRSLENTRISLTLSIVQSLLCTNHSTSVCNRSSTSFFTAIEFIHYSTWEYRPIIVSQHAWHNRPNEDIHCPTLRTTVEISTLFVRSFVRWNYEITMIHVDTFNDGYYAMFDRFNYWNSRVWAISKAYLPATGTSLNRKKEAPSRGVVIAHRQRWS